jgi:hypothetical protein
LIGGWWVHERVTGISRHVAFELTQSFRFGRREVRRISAPLSDYIVADAIA